MVPEFLVSWSLDSKVQFGSGFLFTGGCLLYHITRREYLLHSLSVMLRMITGFIHVSLIFPLSSSLSTFYLIMLVFIDNHCQIYYFIPVCKLGKYEGFSKETEPTGFCKGIHYGDWLTRSWMLRNPAPSHPQAGHQESLQCHSIWVQKSLRPMGAYAVNPNLRARENQCPSSSS